MRVWVRGGDLKAYIDALRKLDLWEVMPDPPSDTTTHQKEREIIARGTK